MLWDFPSEWISGWGVGLCVGSLCITGRIVEGCEGGRLNGELVLTTSEASE